MKIDLFIFWQSFDILVDFSFGRLDVGKLKVVWWLGWWQLLGIMIMFLTGNSKEVALLKLGYSLSSSFLHLNY